MTPHLSPGVVVGLSLLLLISGFGIPVMAALNSGLGRHLASASAATATLFVVGAGASLLVAAIVGIPPAGAFLATPPQLYLGALFQAFYVLAITFSAPRMGVANAVFFVLLGQLIAAATIDHFGFMGAIRSALTLRRSVGLGLMMVGLYFARRPL